MSERSAFVMAVAPLFLQGSYRKVGRRRNSAIGTKISENEAVTSRHSSPSRATRFAHGVERQGRSQDVRLVHKQDLGSRLVTAELRPPHHHGIQIEGTAGSGPPAKEEKRAKALPSGPIGW